MAAHAGGSALTSSRLFGLNATLAHPSRSGPRDRIWRRHVGERVKLARLRDVPVLAKPAAEIAASRAERQHRYARGNALPDPDLCWRLMLAWPVSMPRRQAESRGRPGCDDEQASGVAVHPSAEIVERLYTIQRHHYAGRTSSKSCGGRQPRMSCGTFPGVVRWRVSFAASTRCSPSSPKRGERQLPRQAARDAGR
jgi:hypothetical protein